MQIIKQGYKQTEIGIIPEDWEVLELGRIGKFSKGSGIKKDDSQSGEIACVRYGEIYTKHNNVVKHYHSFISYEVARNAKKLKTGDILFAGSGETKEEIGKSVAVIDDMDVYAGGDIVVFSPLNSDSIFLGYLLDTPLARLQKSSRGQGDAVVHISASNLSSVKIPIPPLKEQTAIATALSDIDALISELDKLIAKKQGIKQATMQQLLTGKKRLAGFSGEWEVKKLGDICNMKSGQSITSQNIDEYSEYPCYGGNGVRGFTNQFTHNGCYALIGRQGALCGNVLKAQGKFFASEHAVVVTPFREVDIHWLTLMLGEMKLNQYSESSAQPGLSVSKILQLYLNISPYKQEQTAIANILSDMDAEISQLEGRRAKMGELKQGMMQELLTGRIRLI